MDPDAIHSLLGSLPGGGIAVLAVWFALRKDAQCTSLMEKMQTLAEAQAASAVKVQAALDGIRDAIRVGIRS